MTVRKAVCLNFHSQASEDRNRENQFFYAVLAKNVGKILTEILTLIKKKKKSNLWFF